jgi:DNA (cytosine-5)-methyltransferase 1
MKHGSLFSGIGGFDLAAEWMGWENVFHCEWNEFGQKLLKYYWPKAISYEDITKTDFSIHRGEIDILTGGFPCQPYSMAGKRLGKEDERHLWPDMLRAIQEIEPTYVVGENVRGLTNWNGGLVFEEVCADLESCGYEVQPILLPAASVNAPHKRDRIWFVASNPMRLRLQQRKNKREMGGGQEEICRERYQPSDGIEANGETTITPNTNNTRLERSASQRIQTNERGGYTIQDGFASRSNSKNSWNNFPTQSPICGGDDGLPTELDGITFPKWRAESIKAYGNAIVPQVVYQIFKSIEEYISLTNE